MLRFRHSLEYASWLSCSCTTHFLKNSESACSRVSGDADSGIEESTDAFPASNRVLLYVVVVRPVAYLIRPCSYLCPIFMIQRVELLSLEFVLQL